MKTFYRALTQDNVNWKDWVLPLEVIPNHLGINLCCVDGIGWQQLDNGQLCSLTIAFKAEEHML